MPANASPIFPGKPNNDWGGVAVLAANTTVDLTSGTSYLVFTADATVGSRVDYLKVMPLGTNIATVMRVWLNNGSTTATAVNNTMLANKTCPVTTVSQTAELAEVVIPLDVSIEPGHKLYVTLGTAVAAGFHVTALGGDY